jgi:hypothetical protein
VKLCAVLCCAVQLQGYLSQPRTISSHHFGSGLLKGEVLPANSRLVRQTEGGSTGPGLGGSNKVQCHVGACGNSSSMSKATPKELQRSYKALELLGIAGSCII